MLDVAEAHLGLGDAGAVEIGAGDRQHVGRGIDADGAVVERREQLEQAAGAGAEIEHALERALADGRNHRRLDRGLGDVQRADRVPLAGMVGEIAARRLRMLAA